jgi:hypothetical protein
MDCSNACQRSGARKMARMFFFEKKNQKTFAYLARASQQSHPGNKSFLLLFFKKEDLPVYLANCNRRRGASEATSPRPNATSAAEKYVNPFGNSLPQNVEITQFSMAATSRSFKREAATPGTEIRYFLPAAVAAKRHASPRSGMPCEASPCPASPWHPEHCKTYWAATGSAAQQADFNTMPGNSSRIARRRIAALN